NVRRRLHQPLSRDHALAVMRVSARAEDTFEHRGLRLLDLQEQRVVLVAAGQQHDVAAGPDAAHAHHLVGRVDVAVLLQGVVLPSERAPVRAEHVIFLMIGVGFSHSDPAGIMSSIGMMTGGSATMRSSPSTSSARLANTRVLSRVLALAAISSIARASLLPTRLTRTSLRTSLSSIPTSKCSYHASRLPIPAARRIR